MVSTQDFAHEVWVSLENIRERLAVVETEIKHARRDLMRLETNLQSHVDGHHTGGRRPRSGDGHTGGADDAAVNVRFNRKLLGGSAAGAAAAGIAAAGKALGWW